MMIFFHSSYTQIPRIINVTMIYLHPHKRDSQLLMFTSLQNDLYEIISHSNITITIFLHSSYTQIPRIINVTMIYLHPHKQDFGVNCSCSHPSRMVCMQSFHTLPSQSQFSCTSHIPRCYGLLENYIIITLL
jgi:hypothetical protein